MNTYTGGGAGWTGFPDSSVGKESTCNATDSSLIPGWGRSAGEGIDYPLQYSWASLMAQLVKNLPVMWENWVWSLVGKIPWRRERVPTPLFWPGEFPGLYSLWGGARKSDTTEWLSLSLLWSENLSHRLVSSLSYRLDVLCSYSVILVRILKQSIFLCQKFKINF